MFPLSKSLMSAPEDAEELEIRMVKTNDNTYSARRATQYMIQSIIHVGG